MLVFFKNLIMLILVTPCLGNIGAAMCLQAFLSDNSYVNQRLACPGYPYH